MIDWALDAIRNELIWLLLLVVVIVLVALPKFFKKLLARDTHCPIRTDASFRDWKSATACGRRSAQRQTRTRGFIQALSHGIRNIMIKMNFRNAIQEIYMHIAKIGLAFVVARKRIIASQVQ
jgi:hypothetical protein